MSWAKGQIFGDFNGLMFANILILPTYFQEISPN